MRLKDLIDFHLAYFRTHEMLPIQTARNYYRNNFFQNDAGMRLDKKARLQAGLLSKNIIFPIAESAVAGILGNNMQVDAIGMTPESEERAIEVTALNAETLRENLFRPKANLAMVDDVLCGRHVFKTGWNSAKDMAVITTRDPVTVFFDMSARLLSDIRYILEANLMPWDDFVARVKTGRYKVPSDKYDTVKPAGMPDWMINAGRNSKAQKLFEAPEWIIVWEYYDIARGFVVHYLYDYDVTLMAKPLPYNPFSIGTLNINGVDNQGLSEVQLILEQQEGINDLMTLINRVARKSIPRTAYDKDELGEDDVKDVVNTAEGDYVGLARRNTEVGNPNKVPFPQLFWPLPMPQEPTAAIRLLAQLESDVSYISATADMARGQVANVRTAAEVEAIKLQLGSRAEVRSANFADSVEDVVTKAYWLSSRYMTRPKMVKVVGADRWANLSFKDLREISVVHRVVANNPIRMTPSVQAEMLAGMMPLLKDHPAVNQRQLVLQLLRSIAMESAVMPKDQYEAASAAAAQGAGMEAANAAGPAVDPKAAMDAGAMAALPPEVAAAMAAGAAATPPADAPAPEMMASAGQPMM